MILGALLDAGLPSKRLRARLAGLRLPDFDLQMRRVSKERPQRDEGRRARCDDAVPERHLSDLLAIIAAS